LINDADWTRYLAKQERAQKLAAMLEKTRVSAELLEKITRVRQERLSRTEATASVESSAAEASLGSALGSSLAQFLRRPEIVVEDYAPVIAENYPEFFAEIAAMSGDAVTERLTASARNELKTVETEIKYAGYLDQQKKSIERLKKSEQRVIPEWFDYSAVSGLSREMNEKLQRVRPRTLGQASRIPGVTPAAVSLIHVYIEIQGRRFAQAGNLAADLR
jgi:tRNA uridine 5-carboxymethylaminomethyl modification enzyme